MMFRHESSLALALLCLLATSVVACETQDFTPDATMQTMPESRLAPFPNSTLLVQGAFPRTESFLEATSDAYLLRKFGTNASYAEVIDYYASLLGPLGWKHACPACLGWDKPGYRFEIMTETPGSLPSSQRGYELVYDELLKEVRPPPTRTVRTSGG